MYKVIQEKINNRYRVTVKHANYVIVLWYDFELSEHGKEVLVYNLLLQGKLGG